MATLIPTFGLEFFSSSSITSTHDNQLLHVLFYDNKNTSFHFVEIYYFDYNHVGYTSYSDFFDHCLANFDHLVLNYIVNCQIDYSVCCIPVVIYALA
jgi:hypothetical protein